MHDHILHADVTARCPGHRSQLVVGLGHDEVDLHIAAAPDANAPITTGSAPSLSRISRASAQKTEMLGTAMQLRLGNVVELIQEGRDPMGRPPGICGAEYLGSPFRRAAALGLRFAKRGDLTIPPRAIFGAHGHTWSMAHPGRGLPSPECS